MPDEPTPFPPYTTALLELLRRDLGDRPPAPARPALPPALRALVSLLGDPPRAWLRLGYWELEVRDFLRVPDFLDGVDIGALDFDRSSSVELGNGHLNEILIASWRPGDDEVRLWNYVVKQWSVEPLGTLEEFLAGLPACTTGDGRVPGWDRPGGLRDLLTRARGTIVPALPGHDTVGFVPPPGIGTTATELLGRTNVDIGDLVRALPDTHPRYAATCYDLRTALLALVDEGAVTVRSATADADLTPAVVAEHPGLATPGAEVWRPGRADPLRIVAGRAVFRDWPAGDGRTELPPAVEVDPDTARMTADQRDLLEQIYYEHEPCPLGWVRPPLGTDSAAFAATLELARTTVLDLYRAGLVAISLADGVANTDVEALLATDHHWGTWCDDVAVRVTPAARELF